MIMDIGFANKVKLALYGHILNSTIFILRHYSSGKGVG